MILLYTVSKFSNDIGMRFGESSSQVIERGKCCLPNGNLKLNRLQILKIPDVDS